MGLADDLAAGPPRDRRAGCSVGALLAALPAVDREALEGALRSQWSGQFIADQLRRNGIITTSQTINRHRAGRCLCSPIS